MTPLPFWQLLVLLMLLLIVGRLVAGVLWWLLSTTSPRLGRGATRLAGNTRLSRYLHRRWPHATGFAVDRVAVDRFLGLPLTLMTLLALYLVFLGAGLAEDVVEGDEIIAFDHHVNAALGVLRNADFLHLVAGITALGGIETILAVMTVSVGFLWAHQRSRYIPGLLLTVVGSQTLTYIGKYAIDRARPDFLTFASATTPSFPSAHATGAIAVYGFVIYAIARDLPGTARRFELAYWGTALIALIAASRAILSVHFASDIAAGLLVGGFWLLAGFALTEYLRENRGLFPALRG